MKLRKDKKWTLHDQVIFLKKLGLLLNKGYTLSVAIELLQFQKQKHYKYQLQECIEKLKNGHTLHRVLEDLDFSKEALSYLFFAEKHGDLSLSLCNSARLLETKNFYHQKIKKMLRYPLFLVSSVIMLLSFVYHFLLPQFVHLYSSMNIKPTLIMQFLVNLPDFTNIFFLVILFLLLFFSLSYYLYFRKQTASRKMNFFLMFPTIKTFLVLKNTQYFALQLSTLLKGGLSIFDSLSVFEEQHHLSFFKEEATRIKRLLVGGEEFHHTIVRKCYEQEFSTVVLHGQTNGNLGQELEDYSEFLTEKIEDFYKTCTSIIQPILLIGLGGFVITLYLSIMLPLFQMIDGV